MLDRSRHFGRQLEAVPTWLDEVRVLASRYYLASIPYFDKICSARLRSMLSSSKLSVSAGPKSPVRRLRRTSSGASLPSSNIYRTRRSNQHPLCRLP
jgi:hypothetical protein